MVCRFALVAVAASIFGCATTGLPEPEAPYLAVRGQRLLRDTGALEGGIVHTYVIWKRRGETAKITENRGDTNSRGGSTSWDQDDETYRLLTGRDAVEAIGRLERTLETTPTGHDRQGVYGYVMWPGPNCNSYTAGVLRRARISVDLPPSAVGKDWPDAIPHLLGFHASTTGLGLQLDVGILGLQVGLVEGVELHLLGSALGVALWPPALKLPFIGRIGLQ
ncbi:MAG: DUF3750 domain-containing protein [Deltaproteobacteria bacterium]|nr:DUF3750 domain-containing protein [Deltaproteobacteria bacterium]